MTELNILTHIFLLNMIAVFLYFLGELNKMRKKISLILLIFGCSSSLIAGHQTEKHFLSDLPWAKKKRVELLQENIDNLEFKKEIIADQRIVASMTKQIKILKGAIKKKPNEEDVFLYKKEEKNICDIEKNYKEDVKRFVKKDKNVFVKKINKIKIIELFLGNNEFQKENILRLRRAKQFLREIHQFLFISEGSEIKENEVYSYGLSYILMKPYLKDMIQSTNELQNKLKKRLIK